MLIHVWYWMFWVGSVCCWPCCFQNGEPYFHFKVSSLCAASPLKSPQAHLHVVGMLQFMSVTQTSRACPLLLYSVLVSAFVFMVLSTVFHSINSPNNSPLSHSVPAVLCLPYWFIKLYISLYESLPQPWFNPLWLTWLKAPTNSPLEHMAHDMKTKTRKQVIKVNGKKIAHWETDQ